MLRLLVIFILVPLVELYVILKIGDLIGIVPTLALLVADSLLGSWLLRSQGRAVWRQFRRALNEGRVPHREVLDGVLVIFGGAFLITPGFITDVIGALCLFPFTRPLMRRLVARRLGLRLTRTSFGPRARPPYDVDGTATEYHEPPRAWLER
ncbi:MAG: FxsA family protein [Thermoleophilaceae bacterium]|nr:FxsA family protein [Thermoleophilaceae bacterium]